jgi:hypothetical protein
MSQNVGQTPANQVHATIFSQYYIHDTLQLCLSFRARDTAQCPISFAIIVTYALE